ncbi:MAG: sensor histidine kinase, partial [Spirochaetales bacterium]
MRSIPQSLDRDLLDEYIAGRTEQCIALGVDSNGIIKDVNAAFLKLFGPGDVPADTSVYGLLSAESTARLKKLIEKPGDEWSVINCGFIVNSTIVIDVRCHVAAVADRRILLCERTIPANTDVLNTMTQLNNDLANMGRELKRKNMELESSKEALSRLVAEKEMLMAEMNHRMMNNLSMISSMLSLEAGSMSDENFSRILEEFRSRIGTIALLHKNLYSSDNISEVDLAHFLGEMTKDFASTYLADARPISLRADIQPLKARTKSAVAIGLIVNELVTNSVKHAFPDGRPGEIAVSGSRISNDEYRISVRDNGAGFHDSDNNGEIKNSLGHILIPALVKDIGGTLVRGT